VFGSVWKCLEMFCDDKRIELKASFERQFYEIGETKEFQMRDIKSLSQ
jgi:hypothetical protein